MKLDIKKIYQQTSNFLFSNMNKQLLVFLFFLALSSIFWLLTTLNETYEQEFSVTLQLTDVPENVVVTSPPSDTIRVTLRDKGYTLISYSTTRKLRPLVYSFPNQIGQSGEKGSISFAEVQKQLYKQLHASSKIVSMKPEKIEFQYNYGESKRVPIRLVGEVIPAQNYYLAQTLFQPDSVLVYASRQVLDTLQAVQTEWMNVKNFEDTLSATAKLRSIVGAKVVPNQVSVRFFADILTEEKVDVPIKVINAPADKLLRTFPSHTEVTFQVGASKIRSINAQQFTVVADYNEIVKSPSDKCRIYLRTYPKVVSKPKLKDTQVDYIIEQR